MAGTTDPAAAPVLPTGRYLGRLPARRDVHFRLQRTKRGSTFHVGVLFVGVGDSVGEGVRIELGMTPGDQGCGSAGVFRPTVGETAPVLFASASTWTDTTGHPCATAEEMYLSLGAPSDPADAGRDVELLVYEEPPLPDHAFRMLLPPDEPAWLPVDPAPRPREVPLGSTPGNAPVVRDGSHAVTLRPGHTRVLAVPLDWDQHLQAQLDVDLPPGAPAPDGIRVDLVSPMLGTGEVGLEGREPDDWTPAPTADGGPLRTGALSHVVSYRHRDSYDATVSTASLAGLHYVLVTWSGTGERTPDDEDLAVPATLTVRVRGVAGAGLPAYTFVPGLPPPAATSRLVDGTLRDVPPTPARTTPSVAADDGLPGGSVGVVAAGVAALAVLLLVVGRRRRRG